MLLGLSKEEFTTQYESKYQVLRRAVECGLFNRGLNEPNGTKTKLLSNIINHINICDIDDFEPGVDFAGKHNFCCMAAKIIDVILDDVVEQTGVNLMQCGGEFNEDSHDLQSYACNITLHKYKYLFFGYFIELYGCLQDWLHDQACDIEQQQSFDNGDKAQVLDVIVNGLDGTFDHDVTISILKLVVDRHMLLNGLCLYVRNDCSPLDI